MIEPAVTATAASTSRVTGTSSARPSNRRELIIAAAGELFATNGYEYVGMAEIAEAVGVRPSALYRHFPGKEQLLETILQLGLADLEVVVSRIDLASGAAGLVELAEFVVEGRGMVALLTRELAHLADEPRLALDSWVVELVQILSTEIIAAHSPMSPERADLLSLAALSVMQGPAIARVDLSPAEHALVIAELAERIISAPPTTAAFGGMKVPARAAGLSPLSRREALLIRAVSLFAQRTYASVSIEDIAAAENIAGPSVYNHFRSKAEILDTALSRGSAYLSVQLADVLATAEGPAEALRSALASYIGFAFTNPGIIDLLISEVRSLPEPARSAKVTAQREYVAELVHLLTQIEPGLSGTHARIRIQAALMIANDIARSRDLHDRDGIAGAVLELCDHLLALPPASTTRPRLVRPARNRIGAGS